MKYIKCLNPLFFSMQLKNQPFLNPRISAYNDKKRKDLQPIVKSLYRGLFLYCKILYLIILDYFYNNYVYILVGNHIMRASYYAWGCCPLCTSIPTDKEVSEYTGIFSVCLPCSPDG